MKRFVRSLSVVFLFLPCVSFTQPNSTPALNLLSGGHAAGGTGHWRCALDLHQGDTGTLEFTREGSTIKGKTVVGRGQNTFVNEIHGQWNEGEISFSRILSATSYQPFRGAVSPTGRNRVRMEGQFAAGYRGTWTCECKFLEEVAKAKLTQERLRSIAQEAISTDSLLVRKPTFRVYEGRLYYDFGSCIKIAPPSSKPGPLDIPLNAQLQIELLKKHYSAPEIRAFWNRYFERAEQLISKMLDDIESNSDSENLLITKLNDHRATIDQILKGAVQDYTSRNNLTVSPGGIPRLQPYIVTLKTSPPNGKIWLASELDAKIADALGEDPDLKMAVMTQVDNVPLLGAYRYKVEWEQQQKTVRGTTKVLRDGVLTLE